MATFGGRDYSNDKDRSGNDVPRDEAPRNPASGGTDTPREPFPPRDNRGDYGNRDRRQDNRDGNGRSGGNGGGYDRDPNYAFISYLYQSGKKGGFTVFLKRDMLEILKSLEDDDILGITPAGKYNGWALYARRVDQQQKEEYRRNGGRGGGFRR